MPKLSQITRNIYLAHDFINTAIIKSGRRALLIDCADFITPGLLASLGIDQVEAVLFTQHRRTVAAGVYNLAAQQPDLYCSVLDRELFEQADAYWSDDKNRWRLMHYQPGPQVLPRPVRIKAALADKEELSWRGFTIQALATPGPTEGSMSFLVQDQARTICFCGSTIYGKGQLLDIYSLQKGHGSEDYHGFMGNAQLLQDSLARLGASEPDILVPSHGPLIHQAQPALELASRRLKEIYASYYATSSMNYYTSIYFPGFFGCQAKSKERMPPARQVELPDFLHYLPGTTSFVLISKTGAALVLDCGGEPALAGLQQLQAEGLFSRIEACWITHYHHDHVEAVNQLRDQSGCRVISFELTAAIIREPAAYYLPCVSPQAVTVDCTVRDGQSWTWHEFKLTAYSCPGQTLYDGALFVEKDGLGFLAVGDSFSPNGLDDYCCQNRNLLSDRQGFFSCLALLRRLKPDFLLNQHQAKAFVFQPGQLDYLEQKLLERKELLASLLPWPEVDFGLDEWWLRTYPYTQEVAPGSVFSVEVQLTNHLLATSTLELEPVLPPGWAKEPGLARKTITVPARTDGTAFPGSARPDGRAIFSFQVPDSALPGREIILFRVRWNGRYLGQFRHALLDLVAD